MTPSKVNVHYAHSTAIYRSSWKLQRIDGYLLVLPKVEAAVGVTCLYSFVILLALRRVDCLVVFVIIIIIFFVTFWKLHTIVILE